MVQGSRETAAMTSSSEMREYSSLKNVNRNISTMVQGNREAAAMISSSDGRVGWLFAWVLWHINLVKGENIQA